HLDPQQRVLMELAWEALEDAGIPPFSLAGSRAGVFIATLSNDYGTNLFTRHAAGVEAYSGTGNADTMASSRVSYFLDLRGPSLTVDTACSGSLVALKLACESLSSGTSTLAFAGGVNAILRPDANLFFSKAGALAPDGRCKPFDARANGIVRSEGAGIVLLQPLSRALADGRRIDALILGGAINHDGRSNGVMAPNGQAQEELLREAYRRAGVTPGQVQYVEAHGTGTHLGDPVEAKALGTVLGAERAPGSYCALGSVKSNLGHTEAAAGICGVIKTALALKHRQIPATVHFATPNPLIPFADLPLRVQRELGPWPAPEQTLVAGVSCFGIGGTNAHVVLQEAPHSPPALSADGAQEEVQILALSAHDPAALGQLAASFRELSAGDQGTPSLAAAAYTAAVHRSHLRHRLALTATSRREAAGKLAAFTAGEASSGLVAGSEPVGRRPQLVMVFSGQGSHWCRMGWRLFAREERFAEIIRRCDELLRDLAGWSLIDELSAPEPSCRFAETAVAQPAIFAVQVALVALWRSWGIVPHTVIGQSLGEIAAAQVAGALSLAEALRVVFHRSRLMQRVAGQGATALVGLSADNTSLALAGFADELSIAGSSSPETTVVSGDPEALRRLIASLESRDVFARVLRDVDVAFHSPQMDSLTGELTAALAGLEAGPAGCRFLSTVTGDELRGEELTAAYWARNLRQPFRFYEATAKLAELGHDAFLEIGPHPVLSGSVRQTIRALDREAVVLPSLRRGEDEAATLLGSLAELYANGHRVDWKGVFPRSRRPVALPSYPWQRRRFWLDQLPRGETEGESAPGQRRDAVGHPLLGAHVAAARPLGQHVWERDLSARSLHWLDEHRVHGTVVLPASAQLEMARRSAKEALGDVEPELAEVTFAAPLVLAPNGDARRIQLVFEPREKAAARFLIFSRELGNGTGDKPWILHSSGRVRPGPGETPEPPAVDLDELRQLFSEAVAQQDHYRTLRLLGLDYGPSFQAVAELWRRDGEALARLELPSGPRSEVGAYGIHPALLDAALQTVSAAFGGGPEEETSRGTFVPVGLEGFRVYRPPGPDAWCRVRMRPAAAGTADQQADVAIFDDDGRLVAEVASLRLRRLDARRAEGPLYGLRWRRSARADGVRPADPAAEQGWWLLLADATGEAEQLEAAFRARGEECILVRPGDAFRVAEQGRRIRLDPRRPEHFRQLLEQAPASAPAPQCRGIIHLWNLDAAGSEELTVKALEESRTLGTESVLRMLQALTQADWERVAQMAVAGSWQQLPPLWVITRGAQAVTAGERVAVAQAPVWGLGRVIVREHPELWAGLIDLDPQARGAAATDRLLAELDLTRSEAGVALRDGERYTLSLEPVGGAGGVHLRADASYLITGGFGGLGLAVARWLAEQGARRLFLVGRTPLPARESWCELEAGTPAAERAAAVRSLEALGVSVHPVALDVADEVQVDSFFDRFRRAGWPPIRGVVHAAGVVRDQLLARLSTEAFAEAWRPKVLGAWLLHDKLRDEELDFFVLFSSIASVLGSFGQGNYAAGNAFLDALAHQRRAAGLPATSINWGPWAEVGMAARQGLEAFHRQGGIEAFSTAEGLESLGRAMASTEAQLLALRADWKLWARSAGTAVATLVAGLVEEDGQGAPAAPIGAPGALAEEILAMADPAARRERLGERLLELCGTVLRLDPSLIDPRQPLPTLGIDSIMTMEIRGQIEASFGVEVPMTEMLMGMSLNRVADLVLAGLTEESGAARGGQARTAGVTVESGA
ncbi:MAG: type I polyketide synthase, partial [bacterium]|nr:type I polyketide synthase [bacterium]